MSSRNVDLEYVQLLTKKLHDKRLIVNCLTCEKWDDLYQICMRWNTRPPLRTIVYGCEYWIDDLVPF